MVTEASAKVVGIHSQEGFIRNKIQSRKEIPKLETKSDFK